MIRGWGKIMRRDNTHDTHIVQLDAGRKGGQFFGVLAGRGITLADDHLRPTVYAHGDAGQGASALRNE
jgi:hypothetical protein